MEASSSHYCEKCRKTMSAEQFYRSRNTEKYPNNGLMNECKKCLTMHVDNWNPDTYLWILEDIDVPYIPEEWNKLMATYCAPGKKVTGTTILGRYLAKMQLTQWNKYRWKDNEFLQELNNKKIEEAMKRQGYDAAEIAQAIERGGTYVEAPPPPPASETNSGYATYQSFPEEEELSDLGMELTDEDKIYLRLKWGKSYKPEEWIALEKLYNDMMDSYDIQSAGHIDTLKMVCKTSMKANQLLDMGDVDGAQKMIKMYDSLMKSGKFTAAQNKAEKGEYVDCISSLVAMCEADGFIPRYYTDGPQDKVDRTLQDLQTYTRTLIMEESNLGVLIEKAVKDIQEQKEKEAILDADAASDDEALEAELFDNDAESVLSDMDFMQLRDIEDEDAEADDEYLADILNEGELI